MTGKQTEAKPATVSERTKQAGEIRAQWAWVEPEVWTERMLTALKQGVKGGKWFSLMDKVYALGNLRKAFQQVKTNGGAAGVDHQTIKMFECHLEQNLGTLSRSLKDGSYRPQAVRRAWIPKLGSKEKRPLGIPTVRDRVAQAALRAVLEPIFERDFANHSYGFRPNRGCKDALRRVDSLLTAGYRWVVDADLKSYFDTIPHSTLKQKVGEKVSDGKVLQLVDAFLAAQIMETAEGWTPEEGTPQGAVVTPLTQKAISSLKEQLRDGEKGTHYLIYVVNSNILMSNDALAFDQGGEGLAIECRSWPATASSCASRSSASVVTRVRSVRAPGISLPGRSLPARSSSPSSRSHSAGHVETSAADRGAAPQVRQKQRSDHRSDRNCRLECLSAYSKKAWLSRVEKAAHFKSTFPIRLIACSSRSSRRLMTFWFPIASAPSACA